MRRLLSAMFLVLCAASLSGLDEIELGDRIEMANLSRSRPPVLRNRSILFTYEHPGYARYVGIAFEFEEYQQLHIFLKNQHDIFVLLYEPPEGSTSLTYRLVVDGLWMPDPKNPKVVRDHRGNLLSRVTYELPARPVLESPRILADGSVEFNVRHSPGGRVYLTGDFTNWEPFMIEMRETSPGLYTATRRFLPGDYAYCFIAGGARMTDPLNPFFHSDSQGFLASILTVR